MLSATPVDVLKTNVLDLLKPLINLKMVDQQKITNAIDVAMAAIYAEATKGAVAAAPKIKSTIAPLIVGSIAASGVAAIIGIIAIAQVRKMKKGA